MGKQVSKLGKIKLIGEKGVGDLKTETTSVEKKLKNKNTYRNKPTAPMKRILLLVLAHTAVMSWTAARNRSAIVISLTAFTATFLQTSRLISRTIAMAVVSDIVILKREGKEVW